jgi:hypothetical protein
VADTLKAFSVGLVTRANVAKLIDTRADRQPIETCKKTKTI